MKTRNVSKVFRLAFPMMFRIALCYAAISVVVLLVLCIFNYTSGEAHYYVAPTSIRAASLLTEFITPIFISLLGSIVLALRFEKCVSLEISPTKVLLGFFLISCVAAVCLIALFSILEFFVSLVFSDLYAYAFISYWGLPFVLDRAVTFIITTLFSVVYLLAGFFAVVACLFRRWYTGVLGIVFSVLVMMGSSSIYKWLMGYVVATESVGTFPLFLILAMLAVIAVALPALLAAVKFIPIKRDSPIGLSAWTLTSTVLKTLYLTPVILLMALTILVSLPRIILGRSFGFGLFISSAIAVLCLLAIFAYDLFLHFGKKNRFKEFRYHYGFLYIILPMIWLAGVTAFVLNSFELATAYGSDGASAIAALVPVGFVYWLALGCYFCVIGLLTVAVIDALQKEALQKDALRNDALRNGALQNDDLQKDALQKDAPQNKGSIVRFKYLLCFFYFAIALIWLAFFFAPVALDDLETPRNYEYEYFLFPYYHFPQA